MSDKSDRHDQQVLYGLVPQVADLKQEQSHQGIRMGFLETITSRMDERVTHLEKRAHRRQTHWWLSPHEAWEILKTWPIATKIIAALMAFLLGLAGVVLEYFKTHIHLLRP